MKEKSTGKSRKHMSKRAKLWLANILCFVVIICIAMHVWGTMGNAVSPIFIWPRYLILQCAFTFFSLIVYYLSIIADALSRKRSGQNEPEDKDGTSAGAQSKIMDSSESK